MNAELPPIARALLDSLAASPEAVAQLRVVVGLQPDPSTSGPEHTAYTVASLAAELAVTPRVIRGAIHRGELQAVRRGSVYLITAEAVRSWATPEVPRRPRRSPIARECGPLRTVLAGLEHEDRAA